VTPEAATTYRVTSKLSKGSLHMKKAKTVWTRPSATLTSTGFEVTMYLGTDRA
jgi:coenzyme PQQ precursor peptide PqqA